MSRKILGLLSAAVLVLQAACLPLKTEQPLGTLEQSAVEEQAIGAWELKPADGGAPLYLHIGLSQGREHENLMSCTTVHVGQDGRLSESSRAFYVVEVAGKKYAHLLDPAAQVEGRWDIETATGYEVYQFEQEGDTLRLYAIDRQTLGELVDSAELAGGANLTQKSGQQQVRDVWLTESTENLRAYLEGGGELFSSENAMVFTRLP